MRSSSRCIKPFCTASPTPTVGAIGLTSYDWGRPGVSCCWRSVSRLNTGQVARMFEKAKLSFERRPGWARRT